MKLYIVDNHATKYNHDYTTKENREQKAYIAKLWTNNTSSLTIYSPFLSFGSWEWRYFGDLVQVVLWWMGLSETHLSI